MSELDHQAEGLSESDARALFDYARGPWRAVCVDVDARGRSAKGEIFYDEICIGAFHRRWSAREIEHVSFSVIDGTIERRPDGSWKTLLAYEAGPSYQRRGFATEWLTYCFDRYRTAGFSRVTVAAKSAGRIAWAKLGFEVTIEEWTRLLDSIRESKYQLLEDGEISQEGFDQWDRNDEPRLRSMWPDLMELGAIYIDADNEQTALEAMDWRGHFTL